MSGNRKSSGNELPFDALLQATASELPPPAATVDRISPWKKAVKQILFGLALTTIIFEFGILSYIPPLCGQLLLLLGFRTLRRENRHFKAGYLFAIATLVIRFAGLILNATFWSSLDPLAQYLRFLSYGMIILVIGITVSLRNGLAAVQRKSSVPVDTGNATALIVWYVGLNLSALLLGAARDHPGTVLHSLPITIATTVLMIIYVCILYSFYRQSTALLEISGYVIEPAPVKISSKKLGLGLFSFLFILMTIVYLSFNQYPMEWTAVDPAEHTQVENIKEELRTLGFPDKLLDAMTTEDILICEGVKSIESIGSGKRPLNDGRTVVEKGDGYINISTVYDVYELEITTVAVQLAKERQWKFFYYFEWLIDPKIYRTDAICIHPVCANEEFFLPAGELTGRLLYDRGDTTYTADYYRIGPSLYERQGFNPVLSSDWFATFSFPIIGKNYRGYLSYEAELNTHHWTNLDTWLYYFHPKHWLQYPMIPVDSSNVTKTDFHFIFFGDDLSVNKPE